MPDIKAIKAAMQREKDRGFDCVEMLVEPDAVLAIIAEVEQAQEGQRAAWSEVERLRGALEQIRDFDPSAWTAGTSDRIVAADVLKYIAGSALDVAK